MLKDTLMGGTVRRVLRRPFGKAQKRNHIEIYQAFATQPGGMHRRLKM
jgi:hypothetical protein